MSLLPLVGHDEVRRSLTRAYRVESLPRALLIHGPRGVGKQRLALWLSQLSVCEAPGEDGPCDVCRTCRMAVSLEHPDLHWYFPLVRPKNAAGDRLVAKLEEARQEALVERRVEPLRPSWSDDVQGLYLGVVRNIRQRAHLRPTMARGQVFVIGDAESLVPQEASPEAANALLKLLEEPPGESMFILTASEPGRLLPTIRSRAVPVHLGSLANETVAAFLAEHRGVDPKVADWAAGLSQGSIGRALGFLPDGDDQGPLEALRRRAYDIVSAALVGGRGGSYAVALSFSPAGARALVDLFAFVEEWLRDLGAIAAGAEDAAVHTDAAAKLRELVTETAIQPHAIATALSVVEEARELAVGNVNPQLVVDGLVRDLRTTLSPRPVGARS